MTDKLNTQITLPAWAVTAFIVLFIAYMGFFTAQVRAQSETQTKVDALEKAMSEKADQKDINRMYLILDRIEEKLDQIAKEK